MEELADRILRLFSEFDQQALDLHQLFEAGGNDPQKRAAVLDAIEYLVAANLLEERGNDFYALTGEGRSVVQRDAPSD